MTTKGQACGKLILCGEHAVVHGHPAIAVPVKLCTKVYYQPGPEPLQIEHSLLSPRDEARLEAATRRVLPTGHLTIESDLPVGVGLGSSAALAVAVARVLSSDEAQIRKLAMNMERSFHGDPSGLDVAVAVSAASIWFRRGKPMRVVNTPKAPIVVIDSGTAGDTRAIVTDVASRMPQVNDLLDDIGALVHAARAVLEDPLSLGELLTENHTLLRQLGVSTPTLDSIVDLAIAAGAHGAKLSGAGGGGVCLALIDDPQPLLRSANAAGFDAWVVHDPQ